jgi:nucleotide-binding universal stress UspA family protein
MTSAPVASGISIGRILVATDFSTVSDNALMYALPVADFYNSALYVLHVVTPTPPPSPTMEFEPLPADYEQANAEEQFHRLEKSALLSRYRHWLMLEHGEVAAVVRDAIEKQEIEMVVVGTHGHGGVFKMLMGSVAEEIFREVKCPVMTVGPHVPRAEQWGFRRILLATDYQQGSLRALPYAISLVQAGAEIVVVHALTSGGWMPSEAQRTIDAAEARLREFLPPEMAREKSTRAIAEYGSPAEVIVRVAKNCSADLIVMGARATESKLAATHLPWSVAHQVVHEARCPVLTVRE